MARCGIQFQVELLFHELVLIQRIYVYIHILDEIIYIYECINAIHIYM